MGDMESLKSVHGTLPASWYRENGMYELEKRAIFSKSWLCVSHSMRFRSVGEFVKYEIAGYEFFIIRDRKNRLKAFLNICRHRAYPILDKESGKASILSCKYHGWSYGLSGEVAKAPRFDTMEHFDKSQYSLFEAHLRVDKLGWVWVNLDSASPPTISWEKHFQGVDQQPRLGKFTMEAFEFDHTWEMEGEYNWKNIIDNYNECYHCQTAHPGIVATTKLPTYDVVCQKGWIEHHSEALDTVEQKYGVQPTYLFPNASITISDEYTYLMRVTPTSSKSVKMQYEVYRRRGLAEQEFRDIDAFFKQIENEDKGLSNGAQRNLNSDTYVSGPLHSHNEKGVIYFKGLVKAAVEQHWSEEEKLGHKIVPIRRSMRSESIEAEERFCNAVCGDEELKSFSDW
ncbi:Rieske [2Fe-2S] iron-sulfur domain-containing protein [Exophiala viscosa]|uniref:Choline monooxygenase, chloroplastic n=1 Tax=Exophiala viscosa TaxID=2486360 RepID=A0AAN6E562_9EURO|nr:Rieske [2Fe-2S] iron-sulfur domain-containing protein [Exophiala viscosa]KAI1629395.1 Rieske [2Fe-2S] iron-sulfur domain-containing protein [Exophiala viscosa]